jgi:hypothetical protein
VGECGEEGRYLAGLGVEGIVEDDVEEVGVVRQARS